MWLRGMWKTGRVIYCERRRLRWRLDDLGVWSSWTVGSDEASVFVTVDAHDPTGAGNESMSCRTVDDSFCRFSSSSNISVCVRRGRRRTAFGGATGSMDAMGWIFWSDGFFDGFSLSVGGSAAPIPAAGCFNRGFLGIRGASGWWDFDAKCVLSVLCCVNVFMHLGHSNGFVPVCKR